jgi:ferredoxin-thioredoxin reductase catalytic chain
MITLTDENFEETLQKEKKMVLIDFWAPWCQPCFLLAPILEKVAEDFKDKFILAKVNLEEAQATAQKLKIEQIPTVVLFKKGKPVNGFIGTRPEPLLREVLQKMVKEAEEKENGTETENIIRDYQEYAEKNGFRLNPDRETVTRLVRGLLENEKKYGARYCPCRRITGNPDEDRPKICPCQWHRQEIEKDGHCFCGLFFK